MLQACSIQVSSILKSPPKYTNVRARQVEPFLKSFFKSLDAQFDPSRCALFEIYTRQLAPQLSPNAAIIINGNPVVPTGTDARFEFQNRWLESPGTNHQLTLFDCHSIPGTGTLVISVLAKVKFDELGLSRLGNLGSIVPVDRPQASRIQTWSSPYGVSITAICDQAVLTSDNAPAITLLDYRITTIPQNSLIQL